MDNWQSSVQFFLQVAVILATCRVVGMVGRRCGQPQVVGEMIAGVLLGPSLFGWLAPEWQTWLFPWDASQTTRDTQSYLYPAAQLGLALYLFLIGAEFRVDVLRQHLKPSLAVSVAGMAAPFALGAALAWLFKRHTELFPAHTNTGDAMLFLGASMCITAFPMLARIIQHKGLTGTSLGTIALGAGAINDAAAWGLLAVVLATFDDDAARAVWSISGGIGFIVLVLIVVRPVLGRWERFFLRHDTLSETGMAIALVLMMLGAWFTDRIGLHAVFGAFLVGVALPRGALTRDLIARVQPVATVLLLPLFFTYSGLNTKLALIHSPELSLLSVVVLAAAVLGKAGACWLAARWTGIASSDAAGIGMLMNARGLMELIMINIGLERGLISPALFAILVVMTVVTTLMASPVFDWFVRPRPTPTL
jgi:Kef-type K+ transport system membrane component KefB